MPYRKPEPVAALLAAILVLLPLACVARAADEVPAPPDARPAQAPAVEEATPAPSSAAEMDASPQAEPAPAPPAGPLAGPACGEDLLAGTQFAMATAGCCEPYRVPLRHEEPLHIIARIDALFLSRASGPSQALAINSGPPVTDAFNVDDLDHSTDLGPRISLIAERGDNGIEFQFYTVENMDAREVTRAGDEIPIDAMIATLKGGPTTFSYRTGLRNFELNYRRRLNDRVLLMAGLRWMTVREEYRNIITSGFVPVPFAGSRIQTYNQLFGPQLGTEIVLVERGNFRLDIGGRLGFMNNDADANFRQNEGATFLRTSARRSHSSLLYQWNLTGRYRVNDRTTVVAGIQSMWLTSIATAPTQIPHTDLQAGTMELADDNLHFFGGFVGLEFELY